MGRGNVCVRGLYEGLYYVDYDNFYLNEVDEYGNETEDHVFDEAYMFDSIENFKYEMMKFGVFSKCDRWRRGEVHVILESKLFEIAIVDNEWSYAVMLLQKEDAPTHLQKKHYKYYLRKIREALFKQFSQLGIYGGTWTSGIIKKP